MYEVLLALIFSLSSQATLATPELITCYYYPNAVPNPSWKERGIIETRFDLKAAYEGYCDWFLENRLRALHYIS